MMWFVTIFRFSDLVSKFIKFLIFYLSVAAGKKMAVISTDSGASLPAKDGRAELLNSSLVNYQELTLCARLLSHQLLGQGQERQQTGVNNPSFSVK